MRSNLSSIVGFLRKGITTFTQPFHGAIFRAILIDALDIFLNIIHCVDQTFFINQSLRYPGLLVMAIALAPNDLCIGRSNP